MSKRLLLLMAAAGLALSGLVSVAPSASAAGCDSSTGTVVVVDFGHWGGPRRSQCVQSASSGTALLDAAGFQPKPVATDGSFVCQIYDGSQFYPPKSCVTDPPASAYWSYWISDPQHPNVWDYSAEGANNHSPYPGEVELWAFGAYNQSNPPPEPSPDQIRALYPAPASAGTGAGGSAPGGRVTPRATTPPAGPENKTSGGPSASASPAASATSEITGTSSPSMADSAAVTADVVKGAAVPSKKSGGSSPVGVFIALGVVAVLGAGGWFARRRFAG